MLKVIPEWLQRCVVVVLISASIIFWQRISAENSILGKLDFVFYDFKLQLSALQHKTQLDQNHSVIIDVDDASLQAYGRWPWSRAVLAQLVNQLHAYHVSTIAFDVVFSEPERDSVVNQLLQNKNYSAAEHHTLEALLEKWNPDAQFGHAINQGEVILGFLFNESAQPSSGRLKPPLKALSDNTAIIKKTGFTPNIEVLHEHARGEGFVSTHFDVDGVIRRTPLLMRFNDSAYPALSLAAVMNYLLIDEIDVKFLKVGHFEDIEYIKVTDAHIHSDAKAQILIPFDRYQNFTHYVSAKDVLSGQAKAADLEGKIAFVGTSAIGLTDLVNTPFGTSFPGVEIHAIVADALLRGTFPYRPAWMPEAILVFQLLLVLLLAVSFARRTPIVMLALALGYAGALLYFNYYLWITYQIDTPIVSSLVLLLALFIWFLVVGFLNKFQNELRIKGMFAQYLPPEHMEKIINSPEDYSMEGESKNLTVLFSDIRGFTSISEKLSASELKIFLNTYFTPITELIFRNGGTIDKYVGDMVMAFWGAPVDDEDHQYHAILTALEMQEMTPKVNEELVKMGLPSIDVGIGINTGLMNVGDMGSQYRKAYTVLGDSVNLGSRLESLTKYYGVKILVGQESLCSNRDIVFRLCDKINVKGKSIPVKAYEPLGRESQINETQRKQLEAYHQAIAHYQDKAWDLAAGILKDLAAEDPSCKLYHLYLERIEHLKHLSLPEDWDGVFVHKEK